jgi:serine/threonine protein kinase
MDLFERECKLLERLVNKPRCLQLVQPLSELRISVPSASGGGAATIDCGYCVLEWLDGDIAEYFLRQDQHDALVKLTLFRQSVLGVFALHRESVAHRDIKHDNLRRTHRLDREVVVPIDLGTAVDLLSNPIGGSREYADPVGGWAFSPLEAHSGLGSIRTLATYTDVYALGCLLHDLFNVDLYAARLVKDPGFNNCYLACKAHMNAVRAQTTNPKDLVREWDDIIGKTKSQITLPPIDSAATTVPPAVRDQLNAMLHRLTDADYKRREHRPDRIVRMIDAAIKALEHRHTIERLQAKRAERRRRQEDRARRQQDRLEFYLMKKQEGGTFS